MYKDYSFVFDIDGTICPIKKKDERKSFAFIRKMGPELFYTPLGI